MNPEPKVALVTGANRGIGREIVRQLAARGWRVFLGARDLAAGERAAAEMSGQIEPLQLNITDVESIARAAAAVRAATGRLDALVNNAGALDERDDSVLTLAPEIARRAFDTNTLGPLRVTQAFLPLLEKSAAPRVINVASGAGQLSGEPQHWAPAYSISKTALNGLTAQLAAALHGRGFAVNSVCPGWVRTDMGGAGAPRSVEQGADTIVWLADEAPQTLTGKFVKERQVIDW